MTKTDNGYVNEPVPRFLCDRMLGNLTKYLRFMGFDTISATILPEGNPKEDTILISIAKNDKRYLLTGDRELAGRAGNYGIFIQPGSIKEQIRTLQTCRMMMHPLYFTRCSQCNTSLIPIPETRVDYIDIPPVINLHDCMYCPLCEKVYWRGSHTNRIIAFFRDLQLYCND